MNATTASICPHNGTSHDGTLLCHWTNSPGARGTLNIFWLCISTLGLCVWNAVHPDVPRPKTPGWRVFGKRLWWLFVGLFMPEMLVLVALGQLRQACELLVNIDRKTGAPAQFPWWMYLLESWRPKRRNPDYEAKWWMRGLLWCLRASPARETQAPASDADVEEGKAEILPQPIPADERYLGLVEKVPSPRPSEDCDVPSQLPRGPLNTSERALDIFEQAAYGPPALGSQREHRWTLTHSFYAVMGGFVDGGGDAINIDDVTRRLNLPPGDPERIDDVSLEVSKRRALVLGDPERIPDMSADDIKDRGKAGVLAKSLLVWQLFVFLASCFARWDQSLPLSLLEITTIGHSLCSIIAMVLWWYKPHSIGEATVMDQQGPLPSPFHPEWRELFSWRLLKNSFHAGFLKVLALRPAGDDVMDIPKTITIAAIAVLYALPHLLGLSVHLPTFAEHLFWEIATFTVIGSPLVMCVLLWVGTYIDKTGRMRHTLAAKYSVNPPFYILLFLYPIASMFLVGESVRQTFALPVESFREPQLTSYLPSFS